MALIVCRDCKKEFSTDAKKCPHCGAKRPRSRQDDVASILSFFVVGYILAKCAAVTGGYDICKDNIEAYTVVSSFVESGFKHPNVSYIAKITDAKFDYMDGCKIRVTSHAIVPDKFGVSTRDDFSIVVKKVEGKDAEHPVLKVDLSETMK